MKFENTGELKGAEFVDADLSEARFHNVNLAGAKITEAFLLNARISGMIAGLVVNDVEVAPLISAELDRRYPERRKLSPDDADGVRVALDVVEGLWSTTKRRMNGLPEALLHERVDGEWSCLETFRHLVFVTDLWISGNALGRTDHFHPFGMPPSFMTEPERFGIDVDVDPPASEVIAAREQRLDIVREFVSTLTDDELRRNTSEGSVANCLHTYFNEEWHHNWFANRDLDTLTIPS